MMKTTRMRTRAVVIVHSHVTEQGTIQSKTSTPAIDLSRDTISIKTSKPIKGSGGCSVELVPRRNYMNLLYPNDVINVYFDPGDGVRGYIRTFMGYIDRVERTEETGNNGEITTSYRISCTDMTKPFDMTDIYFNPHLENRKDMLDGRFGNSMLGGAALRTRGITAHGTPGDMIENLATLLLGFGAQWTLPESYPKSGLNKNRQLRRQRSLARIPPNVALAVNELGGNINDLGKITPTELTGFIHAVDAFNRKVTDPEASFDISPSNIVSSVLGAASFLARRSALLSLQEGSISLNAYQTTLRETAPGAAYTILDLIDLSFIEAMTMDGLIFSTSIWEKQGTLASLMYAFSNDVVNELFFDLRPVADDQEGLADAAFGLEYSRLPDELGVNAQGWSDDSESDTFDGTVSAVQYRPAIVMREYPFSVVEGLDLTGIYLEDLGVQLGFVPFGPIFSKMSDIDIPHRVIYNYFDVDEVADRTTQGLVPDGCTYQPISAPLKHLDVVPIKNTDIITSSVGRSDAEVFNFFAFYATDPLQSIYKFILRQFLPIVTPVSIQRHGLRVKEAKTRFANYGSNNLCKKPTESGSSEVDNIAIRSNLIRWALLLDHWNQHNVEYLSGELTLRGMPEIRVGYRLDLVDRQESYYVTAVGHGWTFPGEMVTTVQVTRGQRNDPFPVYVPPSVTRYFGHGVPGIGTNPAGLSDQEEKIVEFLTGDDLPAFSNAGGGNRDASGRLGMFFQVKPTQATARATGGEGSDRDPIKENSIDLPSFLSGVGGIINYSSSIQPKVPRAVRRQTLYDKGKSSLEKGIRDLLGPNIFKDTDE